MDFHALKDLGSNMKSKSKSLNNSLTGEMLTSKSKVCQALILEQSTNCSTVTGIKSQGALLSHDLVLCFRHSTLLCYHFGRKDRIT